MLTSLVISWINHKFGEWLLLNIPQEDTSTEKDVSRTYKNLSNTDNQVENPRIVEKNVSCINCFITETMKYLHFLHKNIFSGNKMW